VTLLTGFLGVGKTTLLNNLLKHPEMAGAAVLINEFGEIGIDHHLVDTVDETMMILDSGCICCSVQGDLVTALRNLSDRCSRREIPPVTRVVIETTGLADPVPVVYTLTQERFIAARYRCDGVVTAVDVTHGERQLERHNEAVRQVAMADRLLLTKCDLAPAGGYLALLQRLAELNPGAEQVEVRNGKVDPAVLFGGGIYTANGKSADVARWLGEEQVREIQVRQPTPISLAAGRGRTGIVAPAPERHDKSVTSFVVNFDQPQNWYGFTLVMGRILQEHGPHLLRVKGLMNIEGDPLPRVIHCVQDVAYPPLNLARWPEQGPFADQGGRLVFIVRDLSAEQVAGIHNSLASIANHRVGRTVKAAISMLPTDCWLQHSAPVAAASSIQVDGWVVLPKRLAKRAS
jgi:G3E family GTPase